MNANLRVLLLGPAGSRDLIAGVIEAHLAFGHQVLVNLFHATVADREALMAQFGPRTGVSFDTFAPSDIPALLQVILRYSLGFDAIICPPNVDSLTEQFLEAATRPTLRHRLRAIGCPNDSVSHLAHLDEAAEMMQVAIVHTPAVHASSVAEYTLGQICFHSRRLAHFYEETGRGGKWPHREARETTHLVSGKTLGVLGGSGKDGAAVVALARLFGLKVVGLSSGSQVGRRKLLSLGAQIAPDLPSLLECADFLSVNCRKNQETIGLLGAREIAMMRAGVIVINPAGAEIIDGNALREEFQKPREARRIGVVVLDMPYGGRRDEQAFVHHPLNALLKECGVLFTPRMAGYTVEAESQASSLLAEYLERYLRHGSKDVPVVNRTPPKVDSSVAGLCDEMARLAREAGELAMNLRDGGLDLIYNPDGSPSSNADKASEKLIRDGLRETGYAFRFEGEESREEQDGTEMLEIVVDGIDGTRNFRDGNFGWCVSIAARKGAQTLIGVVHDPLTNETYVAQLGQGAVLLKHEASRQCICPHLLPKDFSFSVGSFRVAGSIEKKSKVIADIKKLGGREREWGSVALSICAVARGGLGIFIQGNSKVHDHIAALLIATEAGAAVEVFGSSDQPAADVIVTHPSLRDQAVSIFQDRSAGLE